MATPRSTKYVVPIPPGYIGRIAPPVANFTGVPLTGTVPFTVTFTDTSTGGVSSWAWNFGDGGTSTSQNPTHAYTVAGTYNVTLTVTGPSGSNALTRTSYVTANAGSYATAFTLTGPTTGTTGSPSTFTVTPNAALSGAATVNIVAAGSTLSTSSLSFSLGATAGQTFTVTRASDGNNNVSITNTLGLTNTGSPISYTSSTASATTLTLSGPTTGTTGQASTFTVTPNASMGSTVTVTPAGSGATFSPTTLTFTSGSSASHTFTATRATDGTTSVSITNNGGLNNAGTPINFTSSAAVSNGLLPTTTTLTPGVSGVIPFSIGQGFIQGSVPSGSTLSGLQLNTISTWPDGSTRFGIVSGTASMTSGSPYSLPMTLGAAAGGATLTTNDLRVAVQYPITVDCSSFGSATWTDTDLLSPFQTWATGPVMSSWIYRKQVGSDAHLVAWMEIRYWNTGAVEILPWIENGYLQGPGSSIVATPGSKSATYTFTMNNEGSPRFSASVDLPHHTRTPLVNGTILSHWKGTDPAVVVKHDVTYLQQTELVPSYYANVSPNHTIVTSQPSTYAPLQQGSHSPGMGSPGYHPSIGMLPEWDVLYLTSTAPSLWSALQRNAYSAGRYCYHVRDETTNLPARLIDHPGLCLSNGPSGTNAGSQNNLYTAASAGPTYAPSFTCTHHPSAGYLAALVTGRYYHAETTQFVAMFNAFNDSDASLRRDGANGYMRTQSSGFTTRGAAWSFRTLAQAIAIAPTGATKTELSRILDNNIDYYHDHYAVNHNPFGFTQPYSDYVPGILGTTAGGSTTSVVILDTNAHGGNVGYDGELNGYSLIIGGQTRIITAYDGMTRGATVNTPFTVGVVGVAYNVTDNQWFNASWMQDFFCAAWGYIKALQLTATKSSKVDAFYTWNANSIVGRFGLTGSTEYLYRDAAPYIITVCPEDNPDWDGGTGPWHTNWGTLYTAQKFWFPSTDNAKVLGDGSRRSDIRSGDDPTNPTGYWGNLQPALSYAIRHNIPGAQTAYERMTMSPNWDIFKNNFSTDQGISSAAPVWGVKPWTPSLPSWVPALGEMKRVTAGDGTLANNFRDVVAPWFRDYYDTEIINAYSGTAFAPDYGTYGAVISFGGGHSASNNGQVTALVPDRSGLSFVRLSNPTAWTGSTATDNTNRDANSFYLNIASLVDPDWLDAFPLDGTYSPPGIHSYSSNVVIPKNYGGATYGTLFNIGVGAGGTANINTPLNTMGGAHKFSINGTTPGANSWARSGSPGFGASSGYQGPLMAALVPEQNRIYYTVSNSGSSIRWYDLNSSTRVNGSNSGMSVASDYNTGQYIYIPSRRLMLYVKRLSGAVTIDYMDVSVLDPSVGGSASLSQVIPVDPFEIGKVSSWATAAWCSDNHRLIVGKTLTAPGDLLAGGSLDEAAVYEIEIPMDPSTTWPVTRRVTTGVTNIGWQVGSWQQPTYMPHIKCWVLFERAYRAPEGINDSVLIYRPLNT